MSTDRSGGFVSLAAGEKEYRWLRKSLRGLGWLDLKVLPGIFPYMSLVEYPKGSPVCREGEEGDDFYLIYKGAVEVRKSGWSQLVASLGPGQFFGEMALLFRQPRHTTVRAVKTTRLFWLQSRDFRKVLRKHAGAARAIRPVLEARLKELARH
ncbi:MAG: cyclic nucleotide-binding domain-containing protein [Elusimicrobia bacterium]|jgi:CRP-like cAMP-binding protein|nr:cyclic nucleotide-binding domain-containing protein [Elusimicrobiota bacterium]